MKVFKLMIIVITLRKIVLLSSSFRTRTWWSTGDLASSARNQNGSWNPNPNLFLICAIFRFIDATAVTSCPIRSLVRKIKICCCWNECLCLRKVNTIMIMFYFSIVLYTWTSRFVNLDPLTLQVSANPGLVIL